MLVLCAACKLGRSAEQQLAGPHSLQVKTSALTTALAGEAERAGASELGMPVVSRQHTTFPLAMLAFDSTTGRHLAAAGLHSVQVCCSLR